MGLQHYKIRLIPSEFDGDVINRGYWQQRQPKEDALNQFISILPRDTSWGNVSEFRTTESYGSVLYVWRDDNQVRDLTVEWTPTETETLLKICKLAKQMDCLIYSDETARLFDASVESCIKDWKNTKSAKFSENPRETLLESALELDINREQRRGSR